MCIAYLNFWVVRPPQPPSDPLGTDCDPPDHLKILTGGPQPPFMILHVVVATEYYNATLAQIDFSF